MDYTPSASLENICERAAIYRRIRAFFHKKGVLEVETPILSHAGATDVHLQSVAAQFTHKDQKHTGFLHTSPEFAMKRLLAAWQMPMYQITKVFRDNETSQRHNIEFSMLEWYQPHGSLDSLIKELNELVNAVFTTPTIFARISYRQAFLDHACIDPFHASLDDLEQAAYHFGIVTDLYQQKDVANVMAKRPSRTNHTQHGTGYTHFHNNYTLTQRQYHKDGGYGFTVHGLLQRKKPHPKAADQPNANQPNANQAKPTVTPKICTDTNEIDTATKTNTNAQSPQDTFNQSTLSILERKEIWLDLLYSHLVEPKLGHDVPCVVYDFPASQASLAKVAKDEQGNLVAKRFELYIKGLEIANAYDELADSEEQQARFELDNEARAEKGLATMPVDTHLLAALKHMPESVGIALGLDRLVMLACQTENIADVVSFTTENS